MKNFKKLTAAILALTTVAFTVVNASAYTAYMGIQTSTYSFRNDYADAQYGLNTPYFDKIIIWENNEDADDYDYDIAGNVADANYTDVEFTADGTYTVSVDGCDWARMGAGFNLIYFSSDAPVNELEFTDVTVLVDGKEIYTYDVGVQEPTSTTVTKILCVNTWNSDLELKPADVPNATDSVAIRFTVTGLGGAASDAATDDAATDGATTGDAATTGNTAAATDASKAANPETGVEGVAGIAGIAIVATAAVVIARKRK